MRKLVVTAAFGEYAVGSEITEGPAIKAAEADHPDKVVAVKAPPPPKDEPAEETPPPSKAKT